MKDLIRHIIKEETDQTEDKKIRLKDRLKSISDNFGIDKAIQAVGGLENYFKVFFDGDLKKYYQESGIEPYRISIEPNLYIDDLLVQGLDLPDANFIASRNEKKLGDFSWVSGGIRYKFSAVLYPIIYSNGKKQWRVIGHSGDSGFGYSWITKRNTLGKRARMQIFQQIIDKYNLNNYK